MDQQTKLGIPYAIVEVKGAGKGTVADSMGNYTLPSLCMGKWVIACSYLGYATQKVKLSLTEGAHLDFYLSDDTLQTNEVVVVGKKKEETPLSSLSQSTLEGKELEKTRGTSLGEALKGISGVYALQTGPTLFKPVIHGMHSNRVLILNNGVRQEGQQWGSEHAPEIDPFVATKLTVIKGPGSIRYGSDAIAGLILVEPADMPKKTGVHGELNLVGASNNRMGVTSGILQGCLGKKLTGLSWRVQGTYRRAGNTKTPHYYMENTGLQEINYSGALAYTQLRYGAALYFSEFNTQLGIFSGSHAETVPDIQAAIARPEPITPSYFSYHLDRPYQQVKHQLFKANAYYRFNGHNRLDLVFARQSNIRSEYDYIPLSGATHPELYLELTSHTLDVIHKHSFSPRWEGSLGVNGLTQGNFRRYQLLIPNFRNYGGGIFWIEKYTLEKWTLEAGIRYDYRWLHVYMLDNSTAELITPTYEWQNMTGSLGSNYQISERLATKINFSNAWRAPTVNELFSNGVHQSAGSYEIGNANLRTERSYSLSGELGYKGKRFQGSIEAYQNYINGYIYLKPDLAYIHTARGAFPTFTYTQVDAVFRGVDISASYRVVDSLTFFTKNSLLFATNTTTHDYLQLVPANRFENSLRYAFQEIGRIKSPYVALSCLYMARQGRVPPNSDFVPPPSAYMLWNMELGCSFQSGQRTLNLHLSINNITNTTYRDYLDRFRYFTDAPGRNITLRINTSF